MSVCLGNESTERESDKQNIFLPKVAAQSYSENFNKIVKRKNAESESWTSVL